MARGRELVRNRQSRHPGWTVHVEGLRGSRRNLDKGWKRGRLRVIRWTNCTRPRKASELNLGGGWEGAGGQGGAACPALALLLVLLWPGLEIPGPQGLWPEGEG